MFKKDAWIAFIANLTMLKKFIIDLDKLPRYHVSLYIIIPFIIMGFTVLAALVTLNLTRYQIANQYMGRVGLINSGGPSGKNDLAEAVKTAVINKRAGGQGLISGRKAFQRPMNEGAALLNAIQDVYLCEDVTIA